MILNIYWPNKTVISCCVWFIAALFIVMQFFYQQSVGVIAYNLRNDFDLSSFELSFLSSAYFYIYVILQIPAGMLIDRYGPRKLLTIGGMCGTIGCYMFITADCFFIAVFSRVMIGGGMAFGFISTISLSSKWFPLRFYGIMLGMSETFGMVGAMSGNMYLANYICDLGWRKCFLNVFYFSVILTICAWMFIRDFPKRHNYSIENSYIENMSGVFSGLRLIFYNHKVWINGLYVGLMYTSITVLSALWGNPFLKTAFNLNLDKSTFACSLIFIGTGIGAPVLGWLFRYDKYRYHVMIISSLMLFIILSIFIYFHKLSIFQIYILTFSLGFSCSSLILCYSIAREVAPSCVYNTSMGLLNTLALITAPVFQLFIGYVLDKIFVNDFLEFGVYLPYHYRISLSILPILALMAFVCSYLLHKRVIDDI